MQKHSTEVWLPVLGYEGHYEVSDHGRVRSLPRKVSLYNPQWGKMQKRQLPGRVLALSLVPGRYVPVALSKQGTAKTQEVHRLVLEAFVGLCPEGMEGCHNNGDRYDNRLSNLRWDTRANNHADKRKHGTHLSGEKAPGSTISRERLISAKKDLDSGDFTQEQIQEKYSLSKRTVSQLHRNRLLRGERKDNVFITAFGKTMTVSQWSVLSGLSKQAIGHRINIAKMAPEEALTKPGRKGGGLEGGVKFY